MTSQRKTFELSLGYASLGLFGVSIAVLIWFLLDGVNRPDGAEGSFGGALFSGLEGRGDARATFNALLVLGWGLLHSVMARPRFKQALARRVPARLEPAVYAMVASAGLILLCLLYRPIPRVVYALEGGPALLVRMIFWSGWVLFVWCWFHLDLLEVAGLRPILRALEPHPHPDAPFRPTGPFLWCRHPVELAFLVAFWAAPVMTAGHLLFASCMTLYTFIGIDLEERKMLAMQGGDYAEYIRRVPQILPLPR